MSVVRWIAVVAIAGGAIVLGRTLLSDDGEKDRSSEVAVLAGASSCSATAYMVTNRVDDSKTRIYDCTISGRLRCVTYENGIANDSTAVVRVLFASTLGASKPSCVT